MINVLYCIATHGALEIPYHTNLRGEGGGGRGGGGGGGGGGAQH